jgi:hypothetical protein
MARLSIEETREPLEDDLSARHFTDPSRALRVKPTTQQNYSETQPVHQNKGDPQELYIFLAETSWHQIQRRVVYHCSPPE